MGTQIRRHIGQILLDGGFLSINDLDRAFGEQKRTRELLGQVLVKMGVLKHRDINAPLLIQEHLSTIDDAVKIAAGERQLLGALLVQSGRITSAQLDRAIIEQKWTGEKLGDVFIRLGMLTERQLDGLLEFQHNQDDTATSNPLRLGELLIATGYISRDQLNDALHKQSVSHKKIGEVLAEEGYISPSRVKSGFRLQNMLVKSVLAAILSLGVVSTGLASSVNLQWDANTESDLAGYKVYYGPESSPLESTVPVDVSNQTIATISGLDPNIAYNFAVSAYNTSGLESSFSNILPVAEQLAPVITITSPADSASVSGVVSLNVTASDNVAVSKVEFYVNGVLKATENGSPFSYLWDTSSVAPGPYTLMAKAYDAAGNFSQSSRSVTVTNDLIAPTVFLTSPADNSSVSGIVTISSSASDNVGVSLVEFYINGVLSYASNTLPYSFSWDTKIVQNGVYAIVAKAYDNANNSAQSTTVTVLVNNPVPDIAAPVASIQSPISGAIVKGTVTVNAGAVDNVGVSRVEFFVNNSLQGASNSAPYNFNWNSAAVANGTYSLKVKAYDAAGNVGESAVVNVTVDNPVTDVTPPTVIFSSPSSKYVYGSSISISASSTDNVAVTKMELYFDGVLQLTTSANTINTKVSISKGVHTILIKAYDAANNVALASKTVQRR